MELYYYKGIVKRVVDGDTYDIMVDLGFGIYSLIRFRLELVDTPEVRGVEREEGLRVVEIVREKIEGKEVILKSTKKGSFNRYIATIWIDDVNLGEYLLNENLAVKFS